MLLHVSCVLMSCFSSSQTPHATYLQAAPTERAVTEENLIMDLGFFALKSSMGRERHGRGGEGRGAGAGGGGGGQLYMKLKIHT